MRIDFHVKDVVITSKQKALFEKKLLKLRKYIKDESAVIELYLKDETSPEKGGVDQAVEMITVFEGQKIFAHEVDDRLLRAFANAYKSFKRQIDQIHRQKIEKSHEGADGYITKALRALRLKK